MALEGKESLNKDSNIEENFGNSSQAVNVVRNRKHEKKRKTLLLKNYPADTRMKEIQLANFEECQVYVQNNLSFFKKWSNLARQVSVAI